MLQPIMRGMLMSKRDGGKMLLELLDCLDTVDGFVEVDLLWRSMVVRMRMLSGLSSQQSTLNLGLGLGAEARGGDGAV